MTGHDYSAGGVELRHLRAIAALAEEAHFGRAALRLHLAQSTLSRTVFDLESLVGTPLIERSQRMVELTPAGRALVGVAETALATVHDGLSAAREFDRRPLTLGIVGAYGFRWLPALRRRLDVGIELKEFRLDEGLTPLGRDVDVAISPLPLVLPDGLLTRTLALTDRWVALASGHPLAAARTVPLSSIGREPLVALAADPLWRRDSELILRAHGLELRRGPPVSTMYEALALVAEGAGWALAASVGDFRPFDGVALRPLAGVERLRIAAVWESDRPLARIDPLLGALTAVAARHTELAAA